VAISVDSVLQGVFPSSLNLDIFDRKSPVVSPIAIRTTGMKF